MARSVDIDELRHDAANLVALATAGDEVVVTDRGRAVARLVAPLTPTLDDLVATGRLRPRRRALADLPAVVDVAAGLPSSSEVLDDQRGER